MKYRVFDKNKKYVYSFDTENGMYIRSGILDEKGKDTGIDPFMASFPHLIDVGIMGSCTHGKLGLCKVAGIECYQNGLSIEKPNMTLKDFTWIAQQCKGLVNQFALGGRGDPDQHEAFEEILVESRHNNIVPNFTTSGYGMTAEIASICKKYCGAVAVSWYRSEYTLKAISLLLEANVKTNIHYVIGNNSIDEAIRRLENSDFPIGINAVIFLLHKPVGLGSKSNVLIDDDKTKRFFELIDQKTYDFKVGMDSCSVPGAINHCKSIAMESLDTCEGARFSCYIGADMIMVPCSFSKGVEYQVSLQDISIKAAWESKQFREFREKLQKSCPECAKRLNCMGGCPIVPEIVLCRDKIIIEGE